MTAVQEVAVDTDQVVRAVREKMEPNLGEHADRTCLYWAEATRREIQKQLGVRAIIQAGTLMWPRIMPEEDNGVDPTHFSYVWEPENPTWVQSLLHYGTPEMHVWVGIPERNEIVDLTTRYLVDQCKKLSALEWSAPQPPDYLWCNAETIPDRVLYRPEPAACLFVLQYLAQNPDHKFLKGV